MSDGSRFRANKKLNLFVSHEPREPDTRNKLVGFINFKLTLAYQFAMYYYLQHKIN